MLIILPSTSALSFSESIGWRRDLFTRLLLRNHAALLLRLCSEVGIRFNEVFKFLIVLLIRLIFSVDDDVGKVCLLG
jgi:hypothetical protein